jgi:hypothetical protein
MRTFVRPLRSTCRRAGLLERMRAGESVDL